ncbi:MAG: helix-turn-helix domain-containing protein [Bacillota bacterium]
MSSTAMLKDANRLVSERENVLSAFTDPLSLVILHFLYNRDNKNSVEIADELGLPIYKVEQVLAKLQNHGLVHCTKGVNSA